MAAPPDQAHLSMALLPLQGEQPQGQHSTENREMDSEDADPGAAVEGQLIAKTTSLTISDPGNDELEPPASAAGTAVLHSDRAGTVQFILDPMCTDAQPRLVTGREERQDATGEGPETADPDVSMPLQPLSLSETRLGTGSQTESPSPDVANPNVSERKPPRRLLDLPNEVLLHILGYLDVCDLLATSRVRPPSLLHVDQTLCTSKASPLCSFPRWCCPNSYHCLNHSQLSSPFTLSMIPQLLSVPKEQPSKQPSSPPFSPFRYSPASKRNPCLIKPITNNPFLPTSIPTQHHSNDEEHQQ